MKSFIEILDEEILKGCVTAIHEQKMSRPERLVFSDFKIYDRNSRELLTKREMVTKLNYLYPQQDRATIEIIIDIFLNGTEELKRINDVYLRMSNDIARQFFVKLVKKPKDYMYTEPDTLTRHIQTPMPKKKFNKYALPPSKRNYHPQKM